MRAPAASANEKGARIFIRAPMDRQVVRRLTDANRQEQLVAVALQQDGHGLGTARRGVASHA